MIGEERELLTELARLNRDMASLCMRIMNRSASVAQRRAYAKRLIAAGERLQQRTATETAGMTIDGEVLANSALSLFGNTAESHWNGIHD